MDTGRKNEHILYAIKCGTNTNTFKDVHIMYNSIPELDFNKLDTSVEIFKHKFNLPILINAMTGGSDEGIEINRAMSHAASRYKIPMAVGSQRIAKKDKSHRKSFAVVRQVNKDGFILANMGADVDLNEALEAVEMIEANGLQLHLNVLQELMMPEGDRNFTGILENILNIRENIHVPIMVKEVGFGMVRSTAAALRNIGITTVDIGGFGGTNFARIEWMRRADKFGENLGTIGIPTPVSLYDVCREKTGMDIICGGGIRDGLDIAKALIMGANAVSMAYPMLKSYKDGGEKGLFNEIERLSYELKVSMMAAGAGKISELQDKKVLFTGRTYEMISQL